MGRGLNLRRMVVAVRAVLPRRCGTEAQASGALPERCTDAVPFVSASLTTLFPEHGSGAPGNGGGGQNSTPFWAFTPALK